MKLIIPESVPSKERETFLYFLTHYYETVGSDTDPVEWEIYAPDDQRRKAICDVHVTGRFSAPRTYHPFGEARSEGPMSFCEYFYFADDGEISSCEVLR